MSVFSFLKSSHPVFSNLTQGDKVTLNMEAIVKNEDGAYVKFEIAKFGVEKVKTKKHPAQVMRDTHVDHAG
jgi:hypothetical protein